MPCFDPGHGDGYGAMQLILFVGTFHCWCGWFLCDFLCIVFNSASSAVPLHQSRRMRGRTTVVLQQLDWQSDVDEIGQVLSYD